MLNLKLVPANQASKTGMTVEDKLTLMKDLNAQIKEMTAHYQMLKDEVIIEHFSNNVEYRTSKGLLLATYKEIKSDRFQGKEFEAAHPDLYSQFKKETTSFTFLLK